MALSTINPKEVSLLRTGHYAVGWERHHTSKTFGQ